MSDKQNGLNIGRGNPSGPYLRAIRQGKGITQSEAARQMGVSTRTLRRYERDGITSTMGVLHVFAICRAYGISVDQLTGIARQTA